ncbi:EpsI family protein [Geomonas oryzisoli]|uniref:EpsI family protein n=1 Tax=Geomonas oryzisoli TaxID=2847992 RepID=A0ABX8J0V9_9BACT|nr:exosortase C-terminal domain/associated protein EpsI [Geomonas oryzisoli]QWV91849.1 EpsI family protein [Geomonas oryzisoli]
MIGTKVFLFALVLLVCAGTAAGFIAARPRVVVVRTNLEKLPMTIGDYRGIDDVFPELVYRELNADQHVYRHYRNADGQVVTLYIGYYGTAKGGRTGHNPYACLPGAGAAIVDTGTVTLKQQGRPEPVPVNYVLARKDGASTVMLHWYQTAGTKVVATGWRQNLERFKGRVLRNRNDGAFVEVYMAAPDAMVPSAKKTTGAFAEKVMNLLPGYWPVER